MRSEKKEKKTCLNLHVKYVYIDLGMIRKQDKNTRHQKRTTFWIVFHQI